MSTKEELIQLTNKRLEKRRDTEATKKAIFDYYDYCDYDVMEMSNASYYEFIKDCTVHYVDMVLARTIIRGVLVLDMGMDKDLWPYRNYVPELLSIMDYDLEMENFISLDDWTYFSNELAKIIDTIKREAYQRKYLCLYFSWLGVSSSDISKLTLDDVDCNEDKYVVHFNSKTIQVNDECAIKSLSKLVDNENQKPFFMKPVKKFREEQIEKFTDKKMKKVASLDLQSIYNSGILYRLSQGEVIEFSDYFMEEYYKAMSRFLYGEPLDSGEPLSSGEPLNSAEPQIDVEKEAENYILGWQWERFASQAELMIGIAKLHRLEPFFEYYLAWNGIPVELIKLLTPKNISTNGEDRIYITDGRHEIEIESSKNIALKLQDFILVAGDKVFEEVHGYTEDNLAFAFFGARDLGFTNTVEEIYISGILYRLAKFGQEPDDKENLNYYKAVADYMYKGDD